MMNIQPVYKSVDRCCLWWMRREGPANSAVLAGIRACGGGAVRGRRFRTPYRNFQFTHQQREVLESAVLVAELLV